MGDLQLDADTHRVNLADKPLKVGPTEFKLLHYLMRHPERVHSRGACSTKFGATTFTSKSARWMCTSNACASRWARLAT